jgi:hypothetical protein
MISRSESEGTKTDSQSIWIKESMEGILAAGERRFPQIRRVGSDQRKSVFICG